MIKAMFDAVKRGTRSNWQGAIRIRWCARLDSLTAPRHFTPRPIRVSARHANAFGPQKIRAFAIFPAVPSGRRMTVTNPKQQRASREPLI
jgi:hypothetical protein